MPNIIPISKLDSVVDLTIARVIRGLALARKRGFVVRMPKEIVFNLSVCPDDGINAVARSQTTGATVRRSTASEAGQEVVTYKGESYTTSTSSSTGESYQESSSQTMSSNDYQTNNHGRSVETNITYED